MKTTNFSFVVAVFLLGVLCAAALVYFSPLKHLNVVDPIIKDVNPVTFYHDFQAHPEKYLFIDVRGEASFSRVHAQGSINIPLHELYNEKNVLPKTGKTIVLICSGGSASGVGYHYLEHHGFLNLRRIGNKESGLFGIEAWEAADLPVEGSAI